MNKKTAQIKDAVSINAAQSRAGATLPTTRHNKAYYHCLADKAHS